MEEMKSAKGKFTSDPLLGAAAGSTVRFARLDLATVSGRPEATGAEFWEMFQGAILMFGFATSNDIEVVGSAAMMAPGLAITATHVFADRVDTLLRGEIEAYCIGIRPEGLEIWHVRHLTIPPDRDISFLSLVAKSSRPPGDDYYLLGITTRLPAVGEPVRIAGFRAGTTIAEAPPDTYAASLLIAQGAVSAT